MNREALAKKYARALLRARAIAGLSQQQVIDRIRRAGMKPPGRRTYQRAEAGERFPHGTTREKIEAALPGTNL